MKMTVIIRYSLGIEEGQIRELIPSHLRHQIYKKGSPREIWLDVPYTEVGDLVNDMTASGFHTDVMESRLCTSP